MQSLDKWLENVSEENEEKRTSEATVLTREELHQLLMEWNHAASDYPHDKCIHELFEEQVKKTPGAMAVDYDHVRWTYQDLNERANRIARYLRRLGVGPDTLVGLYVKQSLEMVAGVLGILKAGGAYVPLDPSYPFERIQYILEDTQAPVVLTQSCFVNELITGTANIVQLDGDWEKIADEEGGNLDNQSTSNNLAYVIYTSGTTGKPKGVLIPQYAVIRLVRNTDYISIQPQDCVAQVSNISFDAATFEIWGALLNGARLCGTNKEILLSPPQFQAWLEENHISTLFCTTALFHKFADYCPEIFSSLKQVLFGGESADREKVRKVLKASKGNRIVHVYGPTESTTFATWHDVNEESVNVLPIGRPLANTRVYVLDSNRNPVPIGVVGELYIAGDGLAKGYWKQPELTAERFVPNPFESQESRMYKTGDLVCYLPDGNLKFIGRVDSQVKIRGYRIELEEITSVLRQCKGVQEAIVEVKEDTKGNKTLVAYLVGDKSQKETQLLRSELLEKLPEYMVPTVYLWIDEIPLTPNGKVDKKALPLPNSFSPSLQTAHFDDPTEKLIFNIWAEILDYGTIRQYDDFFLIGGHSLTAMQVITRIDEVFGVHVDIGIFFKNPTIRGLSNYIKSLQLSGTEHRLQRSIGNQGIRTVIPMSHSQQRQWFLYQLDPESPMYNEPVFMEIKGNLDVEVLERSLNEVVRRHEVLRTVFRRVDSQEVQVILHHSWAPLVVEDLTSLNQQEPNKKVDQVAREEARVPFDLHQGPPIRWRLVKLESYRYVLFVTMHHIVTDGWSIGVFMNELSILYNSFREGYNSPLPELPIQYRDFTLWQKSLFSSDYLQPQMDYWLKKLGGELPILQLPTDYERPSVHSYVGGQVSYRLGKELLEDLYKLSARQGVTLYMTLLAAFNVLLYRYTGQEDLLIGSPVANRNHKELEGLIGNFINTIVMRSDISGNPSFKEFLGRVKETALEAFKHQDVPFEKLVEHLQPERNLGQHSPLFQVLFVLQNASKGTWLFDDFELRPLAVDIGVAKFDIKLQAEEGPNGLHLIMEYNADLFYKETIERMMGHLEVLLRSFAENEDQSISEAPILTQSELHQLLEEWNNQGIHQLDSPAGLHATKFYVLDSMQNPVPIGVVGELYFAGDDLSKDSFNLPELRDERFVPSPFAKKEGWMYKTGDLVCYLPDGNLKFINKVDNRVEIDRYGIQLEEIAYALRQCKGVKEAIADVKEDAQGNKILIAYLVGGLGEVQHLRTELMKKLPQNLVPERYIWVDEISVSPDGKVDKKALELMAAKPSDREFKITDVSKDKLEFEMLSLWKEILNNQEIHMDSDFFNAGGHSILVILLVARIAAKFKIDIPIPVLISARTPRRLCNVIRSQVVMDSSRIVKLRDGNNQKQIFMVHPAGGGVFCYMDLTSRINTDATIYGIQAIGIDTDDEPLWDVTELVDLYLQEIYKMNHGKSIYFVGWSSGGTLAYEITRRLEEEGHSVEGLILIDTLSVYPEMIEKNGMPDTGNNTWSKRLQLWKMFCESKGVKIPGIDNMTEEEIIYYMNSNAYRLGILNPDVSREMARRELKVSVATVSALRAFSLSGRISADIDWIVASEHNEDFRSLQEKEWRKRTKGQFIAWDSPGTHKNIVLRPNVEFLASTVNRILSVKQFQS